MARFATVRPDGRTHLVPIVFAVEGDSIYSVVDAKPKGSRELIRLANVRENPRVSLLVDHYVEDWPELWWVRADGEARVVEDGEVRLRAIELLKRKYEQYEDWLTRFGAAVVVDVAEWASWSFS